MLDFSYFNNGELALAAESRNNIMLNYKRYGFNVEFMNSIQFDNVDYKFAQLSVKYKFDVLEYLELSTGVVVANNYENSNFNSWLEIEPQCNFNYFHLASSLIYDATNRDILSRLGLMFDFSSAISILLEYGSDRYFAAQPNNFSSSLVFREGSLYVQSGFEIPEIQNSLSQDFTRFYINFGYTFVSQNDRSDLN